MYRAHEAPGRLACRVHRILCTAAISPLDRSWRPLERLLSDFSSMLNPFRFPLIFCQTLYTGSCVQGALGPLAPILPCWDFGLPCTQDSVYRGFCVGAFLCTAILASHAVYTGSCVQRRAVDGAGDRGAAAGWEGIPESTLPACLEVVDGS